MARHLRWQLLAIATIVLTNLAAAPEPGVPPSDWVKARVQGKYKVLLRQIKAPEDRAAHSEFQDLGLRQSTEWKGQRGLPIGYWVYVYPYWYIWRDVAAPAGPMPPYHADHAAGPPDTQGPGDQPTAWASQTPDGQAEWLELEYAEPVVPRALKVYETCAPGAVTKVSLFSLDGTEVVAWTGKDPTPAHRPMGVSVIPVRADHPVARVRIHLNSPAFPGWNEIDAVGLVDAGGKTQWAVAASASSTFGEQNAYLLNNGGNQGVWVAQAGGVAVTSPPGMAVPSPPQSTMAQTLNRLESEVRQTRKQYEELRKLLETSQSEIKALKAELDALKRKGAKTSP
jgi:hypothetical protein